ncbi:hypothetical protein [Kitasatospora sp. CB02891]|uniref:hypothetical protein n=1 Tax=Kitasatospora sp. CB02891 TaxID=2020329 RepID=UPI0012FE35B8|nr:hypothetical protein [Kitasatospora sp. CB02891]
MLATLFVVVGPATAARATTAGNATGVTHSGDTFTVATSGGAAARIQLARADIFRIWLSPNGAFTNDPAGSDLAVTTAFGSVGATLSDAGTYGASTPPRSPCGSTRPRSPSRSTAPTTPHCSGPSPSPPVGPPARPPST